jgi:hypothetical protein
MFLERLLKFQAFTLEFGDVGLAHVSGGQSFLEGTLRGSLGKRLYYLFGGRPGGEFGEEIMWFLEGALREEFGEEIKYMVSLSG